MASTSSASAMPSAAKSNLEGKLELMHLIEQLKLQKRTGWVRQGVDGPESIADHMYRMAVLSLLSEEDEDLDVGRCVQMAVVHDLAEASVGDITPFDGISKEAKQKLEEDAMHRITDKLLNPSLPASKRIHTLWHEYEEGKTREARFVKDLDRLEMALQASEYERAQGHKGMQQFFESSIPKLQHPEVQSWGRELMNERQASQAGNTDYKHVEAPAAPSVPPVPQPPTPLVKLPNGSGQVTDADEEIFHLYTRLSGHAPVESAGLGFVDAKMGLLSIELKLPVRSRPASAVPKSPRPRKAAKTLSPRQRNERTLSPPSESNDVSRVEIQQDLQRLHGRGGDTGSVVWRASIELAKLVHSQGESDALFIDRAHLATASVLELGSGTGVLAALLGPMAGSWTATDYQPLLLLISKNVRRNCEGISGAKIDVRELDWTWSQKQIEQNFATPADTWDIVLAVDCLFNESLVKPFVDTLNALPSKAVVIVSELRSEDVLRLFLESWLALGKWQIWRASNGSDEAGLLGDSRVVWVGWRQ